MNYLSVNNLSKSFADRTLFENVSFGIDKGQKFGLIAHNGAGKSTLLNILTGSIIQDAGTFAFREGLVVQLLTQDPSFEAGKTIQEYIESGNPRLSLLKEYQDLLNNNNINSDRFNELSDQIDASNAWEEENKITEILGSLNFHDTTRKTDRMSGGEKRRLALGKCLIDEPDILLLDEPTNHLDFKMVEWLENYLSNSNMTLLLITHDRYFLDNVCEQILELSPEGIYAHKGNYEQFLINKAEREANLGSQIQKAKNLYKTELEWLRRMPKARGTKSKSRIDAAYELEKKAKTKILQSDVEISTGMQRLGKKIIEVKRLNKSYGERKIISDFNYFFKNGEKIGIVGDNGAGKTTLLNLLTGKDEDYTGSISVGETVSIGYYTQKGIDVKDGQRVIDVVKNIAEVVELKDGSKITASSLLTQFNFSPKKQYDFVEKLSGGEKKRLYLVTILIKAPNFLILDEPTNDLDLLTLSVLENYLMNFKGCVLIVSHDRYFLDRIADNLFVFQENGIIRNFPGNYTQLRASQKEEEKDKKAAQKEEVKIPTKPTAVVSNASKLSYKEKLEFEEIEKKIEELEALKIELQNQLSTPDNLGTTEINELSIQLAKVIHDIENQEERWLELSEKK